VLELRRRPPGEALMATITIGNRFCGPPDSGNGGYVCGVVATAAAQPVAVRLRKPPPLDTALELAERDGVLQLLQGDEVVAEARPDPVDLGVPVLPDHAEAVIASLRYTGFAEHAFPGCFVCGPRRMAGDGLRIFAGPLSDGRGVAAPWVPDGSLVDGSGLVRPEFLWSALDCPGYFATPMAGKLALLGELAARIDRRPAAGEPCVVFGWERSSEGRKHYAGTAVLGPDGEVLARARATWIALKED
jgi:hypothetical protein